MLAGVSALRFAPLGSALDVVEAFDGDGEGAFTTASLAAKERLFEILLDAEMTFPRNASCCFWRYDDIVDCGCLMVVAK